jgi:hypothetical protein
MRRAADPAVPAAAPAIRDNSFSGSARIDHQIPRTHKVRGIFVFGVMVY